VSTTDFRPLHPVSQLTSSEIAEYRQSLERALALESLPPSWAPREELQRRLDSVLAEQDERERIRHANSANA
jgi:hypothetical protein